MMCDAVCGCWVPNYFVFRILSMEGTGHESVPSNVGLDSTHRLCDVSVDPYSQGFACVLAWTVVF